MKRRGILAAAVLMVFLGLVTGAQALTLSEMRTQIRRNIRDTSTDTTVQAFSDATILSYVNEGQKEMNLLVWSVIGSTTITLATNTTYYSLPDNLLAVNQVSYSRTSPAGTVELKEVSERSLQQSNPDFERQTAGPPVNYFTRQSLTGGNAILLGLVPAPSSSAAGTLMVQYISQPADLSGDSDVPFDGLLHLAPYHNLIVYYVSSKLTMIRGRTDESTAYATLYGAGLQLMTQKVGQRPNYNPGAVGGTPNR